MTVSSRRRRKEIIRRRMILFTIAVVAMLGFLIWYLVSYLPQRDNPPNTGRDSQIELTESVQEPNLLEQVESSAGENSLDQVVRSMESNSESPAESNPLGYEIVDPQEGDWRLVLVNKRYRLAENMTIATKTIHGEEMDERIYDSLTQMLEDGERDSDREFLVCSGYRSVDLQKELFENKIRRVLEDDSSLSYEEAYEIAATEVAIPGASEHNTGLTVDICALDFQMLIEEYEETDEAQWLRENCYKYGFILRYPKGKEDVTGIIYEPWHFRYVGVEAATEIMSDGITLEEYLGKVN